MYGRDLLINRNPEFEPGMSSSSSVQNVQTEVATSRTEVIILEITELNLKSLKIIKSP